MHSDPLFIVVVVANMVAILYLLYQTCTSLGTKLKAFNLETHY